MSLKYIDQAELTNKKVLARFDFNVPLNDSMEITDTTRIDRALPTIRYILENKASKLILMSHLGRPKGKMVPKYSLSPVASYLAEKLEKEVILSESAIDASIPSLINLPTTKVVLLENLRFHPEEEKNEGAFCKKLASYADIYVNDAFGAAHRKHASTYGINAYFKGQAYGGFLLKQEMKALTKITENPDHPFVAIIGGAKISDKIKIIENLIVHVNAMFIGGAMAYPFLKAQGRRIGNSLCNSVDLELAQKIYATNSGQKIHLPIDHIVSNRIDGDPLLGPDVNIDEGMMGLDIGPKTIEDYEKKLKGAKTVLWNGPMGMFENKKFANGTMSLAKFLAQMDAFTLVGGGDSVSAVNKAGVESKISHISTGGGASLEFIEQGDLPGIKALKFGVE